MITGNHRMVLARTVSVPTRRLQGEILRKAIHLTIALVPTLARIHLPATLALLAAGILVYTASETLRLTGFATGLIGRITVLASRQKDEGHFVLGPVTLGLGAMAALMLYPHPAATVGIYALAFGDGLSSLAGRAFGRVWVAVNPAKTWAGTLTCFAAIFVSSLGVLGRPGMAFVIALAGTLTELLPLDDMDNLALPLVTGMIATSVIL